MLFQVETVTPKQRQQKPPAPFITSSLQQTASSHLKLAPDATMKLAQQLYENGHITYMRTDSPAVSPEGAAMAKATIAQLYGATYIGNSQYGAKGNAQEAHECIRPTSTPVPTDTPLATLTQLPTATRVSYTTPSVYATYPAYCHYGGGMAVRYMCVPNACLPSASAMCGNFYTFPIATPFPNGRWTGGNTVWGHKLRLVQPIRPIRLPRLTPRRHPIS